MCAQSLQKLFTPWVFDLQMRHNLTEMVSGLNLPTRALFVFITPLLAPVLLVLRAPSFHLSLERGGGGDAGEGDDQLLKGGECC